MYETSINGTSGSNSCGRRSATNWFVLTATTLADAFVPQDMLELANMLSLTSDSLMNHGEKSPLGQIPEGSFDGGWRWNKFDRMMTCRMTQCGVAAWRYTPAKPPWKVHPDINRLSGFDTTTWLPRSNWQLKILVPPVSWIACRTSSSLPIIPDGPWPSHATQKWTPEIRFSFPPGPKTIPALLHLITELTKMLSDHFVSIAVPVAFCPAGTVPSYSATTSAVQLAHHQQPE